MMGVGRWLTYLVDMSLENKMDSTQGWDGIDRRGEQEVTKYKVERVILDMKETRADVEVIKKDMVDIKMIMTEMKAELKQIVGRSSAYTSSIVSIVVSVIGGVVVYYMTK